MADQKEYGGHKYADHDGTSDCVHGCGCWMGPSRSGGPAGIDPFGECPKNPKDGKLIGGNADYTFVVDRRIERLISRASIAETHLKRVKPSKKKLAQELADARAKIAELEVKLAKAREVLAE